MLDRYNLYPLHVFRLVARTGSVTRAAQELFISQPAVSAHLKALETAIGEPLFERTSHGMRLTPAGKVTLERVNHLFVLYEDIPAAVATLRGQIRGEVTVAASSTPGAYLVPELLQQFQEQYPEARPLLRVGDSAQVVEWLLDYQAPLGVIGEISISERLHSIEIGSDHLQLVTSPGDTLCRVKRIKPEHLSRHTLLLREPGSSTRTGAEGLLGSGLGVAVISSWATRLEERAGLLQPVRDPLFRQSRRFFLVRRKDRVLTGNAAALWDCLTTCKPKIVAERQKTGGAKPKM
jgi:DNA-binding transcriptional LysR family regulator